jgi:hypothetical protein
MNPIPYEILTGFEAILKKRVTPDRHADLERSKYISAIFSKRELA